MLKLVLVLTVIASAVNLNISAIRWLDRTGEKIWNGPTQDLFYDRIVYVHQNGDFGGRGKSMDHSYEILAVIIGRRFVLTSFNAWREILKSKVKRNSAAVRILVGRTFISKSMYYHTDTYEIVCARQVIPFLDDELPDDLWQGSRYQRRMHSPLHDLIVLRLNRDINYKSQHISKENELHRYNFNFRFKAGLHKYVPMSPILTILADKNETLGSEISMTSLGLNTIKKIRKNHVLSVTTYSHDDILTDCDEWLPREWGHFICLNNPYNFAGLDNGAMLFSNEKLFGVGSFMLIKDNSSILVFTDIRPYRHLLFQTCTYDDQRLKVPKQ